MIDVQFEDYAFRTKKEAGKNFIFDIIRKKYVVLTPEEWVRQHWVHYLCKTMQYPKALIRVEMGLKVNDLQKRSDIVVFNRSGNPCLIVECKNPDVPITQKTFEQIANYNLTFRVSYLIVSNGVQTYCTQLNLHQKSFSHLDKIPSFIELDN